MPRQEFYSGGVLIEVIDNRTLDDARAEKIYTLKIECENAIMSAASPNKQRSAALGALSRDETARIKSAITGPRDYCHRLEAAIASAETREEVDAIEWRWQTEKERRDKEDGDGETGGTAASRLEPFRDKYGELIDVLIALFPPGAIPSDESPDAAKLDAAAEALNADALKIG